MQPASVTPETIDQVLAIGLKRQPHEACGVILPHQVVRELPNHATNTLSGYEIDNKDLVNLLASFISSSEDVITREDIIIWHTHPSGSVGPSDGDLETRAYGFRYLVVALPGGEATRF